MSNSETREKLILAAMELFVFQGYANTGLAEIARRAGVLPGSLYYFFPTKEDLLHATLECRKAQLHPEVLDPVWNRVDDPIERVFGLLAGYRLMLEMTDFKHGCPIGNLVIEVGESLPRARQLLVENFDNWMSAVAECLRSAKGRLPASIDPDEMATFVLVVMEGAVMVARAYRNFAAYDAAITMLRDYFERLIADATDWSAPQTMPSKSPIATDADIQVQTSERGKRNETSENRVARVVRRRRQSKDR